MLTPICKKCKVEMRCEKNSQMVNDPESGQFPSTYWVGDTFKCPSCKNEIITGFCGQGFMKEEMEKMGRNISDSIEFRYDLTPTFGIGDTPEDALQFALDQVQWKEESLV
jgi:hypothetical protein